MERTCPLVTVTVPVFNELPSLPALHRRITAVFADLPEYDYEIVFFDDGSTDGTRDAVEQLAAADEHVKAVFYARNFGYTKNVFYCMQQAKGDCAVIVHADLQNPPELIPEFLRRWEAGAQVVVGVKNHSRENRFVYFLRTVFYLLLNKVFGAGIIPHATEFELFDRSFLEVLRQVRTPVPFLRGLIRDYGVRVERVYYTQDRRREGRTKFDLKKYYDFAMCGVVNMSVKAPRMLLAAGLCGLAVSVLEFLIRFLPMWVRLHTFPEGSLFLRGIFFLVSLQLALFSLIGEYVVSIHTNTQRKPMIVEEKRIRY